MMGMIYAVGVAGGLAFFWLLNGVRRIGAVSRGKPIGDRPGTALILIDLQTVFWEQGPYSADAKSEAQSAILAEVELARAQGIPIIALRQEWSIPSTKVLARLMMKGQAIHGTSGTELANPFNGLTDHVLVKRVQDGFETGELDALLEKLDVGQLRLVGLDYNYCVLKTALAARNRGYGVTVIKKGTLAAGSENGASKRMTARGVSVQRVC